MQDANIPKPQETATPIIISSHHRHQVIAINQDVTPQGTVIVPGDSTVWSRKLSDGSTAFALVNVQVRTSLLDTARHRLA
jgi:hypothetical protein